MNYVRMIFAGAVVGGASNAVASSWSDFVPGSARQYIPQVVLDADVPVEVPELVGIQTKTGSYGVRTIENQEINFEKLFF